VLLPLLPGPSEPSWSPQTTSGCWRKSHRGWEGLCGIFF
jgi:hypothetical protein